MINILKKIGKFLISKPFLISLAVFILILLCVLFWIYSPLTAFNDIHIFGSAFLRGFIILTVWLALFLIFALKKLKDLFIFFTNENKQKLKIIKHEAKDNVKKTKRNFLISLKEAKQTWKNNLKIHNMPIVLVVGNTGAGKSSFINYADIEYPVTEMLGSYKKHHMSTRNFSLYISKNGALVDTEGSFFSQEALFKPQNTDEMPEDDVEKNKVYLTKHIIWRSFLKLLNKLRFYKRLNGVVLVIDLPALLQKTQLEIATDTAHIVQRISELETYLNLQLPVYIILNKIDLLEGMDSFLKLYNENVSSKVLGITFPKKVKITEEYIDNEFGKIITSLKFSLMNKNHHTQTVQDKKKAYFYVAQLENLSKIVSQILNKLVYDNSLKNKSFLRGVYFTCSYQENIPVNILFEGLFLHYKLTKPMLACRSKSVHQSFFVSSLLKDIIFRDKGISNPIFGSHWKKISFIAAALIVFSITYAVSNNYINARKSEVEKADNSLSELKSVIDDMQKNYSSSDVYSKSEYINRLRSILAEYPQLFGVKSVLDTPLLHLSYKSFYPAKEYYINNMEELLSISLVKEMEKNLLQENDTNKLVRVLYMYKALFERKYLDISL